MSVLMSHLNTHTHTHTHMFNLKVFMFISNYMRNTIHKRIYLIT